MAGWAALKTIYRAPTQAAAEAALDAFEAGPWGHKYPATACTLWHNIVTTIVTNLPALAMLTESTRYPRGQPRPAVRIVQQQRPP